MMLRSSLILICAITLPARAQNVPPLTGTPCLQTANVADYRPLPGNRALVVTDKLHRQYRLDFTSVCDSLQIHPDLGFHAFNPSQYACLAKGDSVYSSRDEGANRLCRIRSIDYYNAEPAPDAPQPTPASGGRARG